MKVIYISKYFNTPSESETGSRGFHICRELSRFGYDVKVLASKSSHNYENTNFKKAFNKEYFEKLNVIFIKTIQFMNKRSLARIISWIEFEMKCFYFIARQKTKPDVIIASSLSFLSIITGLLLKLIFKVKLIIEIRDIWPLTLVEIGGFSTKNPLIYLMSKFEEAGYKYSDAIVGTMPNLKEHVENITKKHSPVFCIPQGVSEEHKQTINFSQKEISNKYDFIPQNTFIVGYAGSFGSANAMHYLFEAAKETTNRDIHYVFVGDGDLKSKFLKKYGHLSNVTVGPRLKKHDVAGFLSQCDVLAFATVSSKIYKYGTSLNKLIDYMLAAKPCLCIYDGYDEIIAQANCGFILQETDSVKIAHKINQISEMPKNELREMGLNGKKWLEENRTFPILAKKYIKIFSSINY